MLLHDSRRNARVDASGALVTLEEQDRSTWDREEIAEDVALVETALAMRSAGPTSCRLRSPRCMRRRRTPRRRTGRRSRRSTQNSRN
jgi:RNA polymerase sigma-70 factor, ECF subfamily